MRAVSSVEVGRNQGSGPQDMRLLMAVRTPGHLRAVMGRGEIGGRAGDPTAGTRFICSVSFSGRGKRQ